VKYELGSCIPEDGILHEVLVGTLGNIPQERKATPELLRT
jgi:hypothetical protein